MIPFSPAPRSPQLTRHLRRQVVAVQQYVVRPQTADSSDSFLSEVCKNDYQLTEEQVKNGESLESAIQRVSQSRESVSSESPSCEF